MKKILSAAAVLLSVLGYGQDQNYVQTTAYKKESATRLDNPTQEQATVQVTYLDGLGRPLQQRAHRQSGTGTDLVTHFAYDAFGRQAKEYLPYPTQSASLAYDSGAEAGVTGFYGTPPSGMEATGNPFGEKLFENSHLNRVLRQAAPGNPWGMGTGHEVRMAYETNTVADGVKNYTATANWNATTKIYDVSLATTNYAAGQLYKNISRNENWTSGLDNTVEEFTNKEGQLVLKRTYEAGQRHDTYYVYDQFGNLTYVFPPLASNPPAQLDKLCYQYKYDHRNRMVEKKLPGRQWQYMAYDRLDRLVATGPAMCPFDGIEKGWLITKYDPFGRVAYTGWYQNSGNRLSIQNQVNASLNLYELRTPQTIDNISVGYSNKVFPTSGMNVLTVSWYDDYSYPGAPTAFGTVEGQAVFYNNSTEKPKGLPTGSWTRVLEGASAYRGELTSTLYDIKGRPISQKATNYMGGHTVTDSKLDFTGKAEYTITKHRRTSSTSELTVRENFKYDLQDRLLSHTHQINSLPAELLAYNSYDKLGRLSSKKVGGDDITASTFYQKVDYTYNIRGWLKAINSVENFNTDDGGTDLFAFALRYNDLNGAYDGGLKPLYNGNISETRWMSRSDNKERSYSYAYDALNRLRSASYFKNRQHAKSYDESMGYDRNGNITDLNRFGDLDYADFPLEIDALKYYYDGNQLTGVEDMTQHPLGFKDGANSNTEYKYDANGNMITDDNKGITSVSYNHMDLPLEIIFGTGWKINYLYDASGKKLNKTVFDGSTTTVTDYLSGFQYVNGTLDFFPTAEGYVKCFPAGGARPARYNYAYNLTDHLGNIRVTYGMDKDLGKIVILEENHYYPFGMKHEKYNSDKYEYVEISKEDGGYIIGIEPLGPQQRRSYQYKYQGQERQDELGLNWDSFKWRNYDYAIGRFMSVDPLTEEYEDYTPYQFASNQPVHAQEVEGLENAHDLNKRIQTRENRTIIRDNIPQTDRMIASTVRSIAAEGGYTGVKSSSVRADYKKTVSNLDITDSKGRTEAKLKARENTPAVVRSMIESKRPTAKEVVKVSGTANKTNAAANATADAFGTGGKVLVGVGLLASTYNVATSDDKVQAVAQEGGAWAGAIAGGEMLGGAMMSKGPVAAGIGAIIGSIIGGFVGEETVKGVSNNDYKSNPESVYNRFKVEENGFCFLAGTKITMYDDSLKNIEDIVINDKIKSFNITTGEIENDVVLEIKSPLHDNIIDISFSDGSTNSNTTEHPYYVKGKGWASFDPFLAKKLYDLNCEKLEINDICYKYSSNGVTEVKIISIKDNMPKLKRKTYNLSHVKENHNFFANGILVHNKRLTKKV